MRPWVLLIVLVIVRAQGITIWVQSPLTNFQKESKLE